MNEADEMEISLGDAPPAATTAMRESPSREPGVFTAACGDVADLVRPVYFSDEVLSAVQAHGWRCMGAEVGGLLLGSVARSPQGEYIRVEQALPARMAGEKRSELTFTHETWAALNEDHKNTWPGLSIVGWYHTHPGLGVFMSERDCFIHSSFFSRQTSVALVVDPLDATRGVFQKVDDRVVQVPGFHVYGPADHRDGIELLARLPGEGLGLKPPRSRWRRVLPVLRIVVVALLGALLTWIAEHGLELDEAAQHWAGISIICIIEWAIAARSCPGRPIDRIALHIAGFPED